MRPSRFLVTLNHADAIDERKIIGTIRYHHPVYLPAGVAAQKRHREINGAARTYYCGAYWRYGFHEDGVVTAMRALEHYSADLAQGERRARVSAPQARACGRKRAVTDARVAACTAASTTAG